MVLRSGIVVGREFVPSFVFPRLGLEGEVLLA